MAEETSFLLKKFERMENIYCLFSQVTKLPYVECDEETFEDCVFLFSDEKEVQAYAKSYTEKKILLAAGLVQKNTLRNFLIGLHCLGINAIRYFEGETSIREELVNVVPCPPLDVLKDDKIPKANAEMMLTAMYFMQELKRPIERDVEQRKHLKALEEEMAVNLMRSRWIVCVDITEVKDDMSPEEKNKHLKIPYVKAKDGSVFQPVFTDLSEVQRFNAKNPGAKLRLTAVSYEDLPKYIINGAKGICFNPNSFNLLLTREQLEQMKRYAE